MPARQTSAAVRSEFGKRTAERNFPPRNCLTVVGRLFGFSSAMTWSTNGHLSHSAARFSGAATASISSPSIVFRLRTAGSAITASPSQLGLRTTSGP